MSYNSLNNKCEMVRLKYFWKRRNLIFLSNLTMYPTNLPTPSSLSTVMHSTILLGLRPQPVCTFVGGSIPHWPPGGSPSQSHSWSWQAQVPLPPRSGVVPPLVCVLRQVFFEEALDHISGLNPGLGIVDVREDAVVLVKLDDMTDAVHGQDDFVDNVLPAWVF